MVYFMNVSTIFDTPCILVPVHVDTKATNDDEPIVIISDTIIIKSIQPLYFENQVHKNSYIQV